MSSLYLEGTLLPLMCSTQNARLMSIDEMHSLIVDGSYAKLIKQIREAYASGQKGQVMDKRTGRMAEVPMVDMLKKRLPLFVPQGNVIHRRRIDGFWHPTPFMPFDGDHLTPDQLEHIMQQVSQLPWVKEAHRSSRGEGVHLIVNVGVIPVPETAQGDNPDDFIPYVPAEFRVQYADEYKRRYCIVAQYLQQELGMPCDPQCKDVLRGLFLSHDTEAFLRPDEEMESFDFASWKGNNDSQEPPQEEVSLSDEKCETSPVIALLPLPQTTEPELPHILEETPLQESLITSYLPYHQYTPSRRHGWWVSWAQYLKYKGVELADLSSYCEAMRQHLSQQGLIQPDDPLLRNPNEVDDAMAWGYEHSTTAPSAAQEPSSVSPSVSISDDELLERLEAIKLPQALKASIESQPQQVVLATLCGIMPAAQTYTSAVSVEYCDGKRQRLNGMSCIVAEQGGLKSGVKDMIYQWMAPLQSSDEAARQKEQDYKELRLTRKANEKLPPPPKVEIVVVPATISCSAFLKRQKMAGGKHLFSFCDEIDTVRKTNGAGSWSAKYDIYRMGFDNGEWGQDYNSDSSESGIVQVAYNWTFMGTPSAMRACFAKNGAVENGLTARVWHCLIPPSRFEHMPKYKPIEEHQTESIRQATEMLRMARGFVDTPLLRKHIEQWCNRKADEANESNDMVVDTFRKRAAVIGFRAGVVFMLLENGQQWIADGKALEPDYVNHMKESNNCIQFAKLVADHALKYQCMLYGNQLLAERNSLAAESMIYRTKNATLFDLLPAEFSFEKLMELRPDSRTNTLRVMISSWRKKGMIKKLNKNLWCKK